MDDFVTTAAVILAGGRGTRSADPTKAKLGQQIAGATLLQWHLRLLEPTEISEVIIVAGYLGEQVEDLTREVDCLGLRVSVVHEAEQRGTVAALRLAMEQSAADRYLVILGDILMSLPVQHFLDSWRQTDANVAVVVHPSTHPQDSDAAFPSHDGRVVVVPKSESRVGIPNMSSAGLFALTRAGITQYEDLKDLGSNVLREAAKRRDLFAQVSSHYLKDTGTPERLEAAQRDVASGAFKRRGLLEPRAAVFLDRDGVINPAIPECYAPEDYTLLPGVGSAIREANQAGIPVIVVTNQPGIAKGFMTEQNHERIRAAMDRLLADEGAFVDDYAYCPHHPEKGFEGEVSELKMECACRKPNPGLLIEMAERHGIDLPGSVMVGDTERDAGAATRAHVRFLHVDDFRDVGPSGAILRAIEVVTC